MHPGGRFRLPDELPEPPYKTAKRFHQHAGRALLDTRAAKQRAAEQENRLSRREWLMAPVEIVRLLIHNFERENAD